MGHVVVERTLPQPIDCAGVIDAANAGQGCHAAHGVSYLRAYLRSDGMRLFCVYDAADAESVRIACRQGTMPFDRAYPASFHEAADVGGGAAQTVVVERTFEEPVVFGDVQAREDASAWCLDLHGVHFVHTLFSRDRRRMVCLYEAPDAEAVRLANQKTGVPFDTVWPATVVRP